MYLQDLRAQKNIDQLINRFHYKLSHKRFRHLTKNLKQLENLVANYSENKYLIEQFELLIAEFHEKSSPRVQKILAAIIHIFQPKQKIIKTKFKLPSLKSVLFLGMALWGNSTASFIKTFSFDSPRIFDNIHSYSGGSIVGLNPPALMQINPTGEIGWHYSLAEVSTSRQPFVVTETAITFAFTDHEKINVFQTDLSGREIWSKQIRSNQCDDVTLLSLNQTPDGNIVSTGVCTHQDTPFVDSFVMKIDTNSGNLLTAEKIIFVDAHNQTYYPWVTDYVEDTQGHPYMQGVVCDAIEISEGPGCDGFFSTATSGVKMTFPLDITGKKPVIYHSPLIASKQSFLSTLQQKYHQTFNSAVFHFDPDLNLLFNGSVLNRNLSFRKTSNHQVAFFDQTHSLTGSFSIGNLDLPATQLSGFSITNLEGNWMMGSNWLANGFDCLQTTRTSLTMQHAICSMNEIEPRFQAFSLEVSNKNLTRAPLKVVSQSPCIFPPVATRDFTALYILAGIIFSFIISSVIGLICYRKKTPVNECLKFFSKRDETQPLIEMNEVKPSV